MAEEGKIISIDKVKKELYNNNDALEKWCKSNLPGDFFKNTSFIMNEYKKVVEWAISKREHYLASALNEFLDADEADAFLIAYCLVDPTNRILVTQEISEPDRRNKIKIPDVCIALNISYVNTIEMFRELGETF